MKNRTMDDWSIDSPIHQEAYNSNGEYLSWWTRNVIDEFKTLSESEIKAKLKASAFPFSVCFEFWAHDFNISSGIRNANAFNAKEIFYIGDKKFDRRGMQGVQNYTDFTWIKSMDEFLSLKNTYSIVGIDNISGSIPIQEVYYKPNTLFVFGSEGTGLTPKMRSHCEQLIHIPQYGSVRSLNCAVASGIVMNDFIQKYVSSIR